MRSEPLRIDVLSLPGCPHAEETLRLAGEVAAAVVPGTVVREQRLTEGQARERGFAGSPTVLVDGRDIEGRETHAAGVA